MTDAKTFRGEIEFKKVWFRYPTKPNQWIFKGLDLKINPQDCIAIVGESGSGKSTFINLVMRFYEPDFGDVFVDGVNIKEYNIASLRSRMGLVMQEPTLFNYSIQENLLYGNANASNEEIQNAAQVANAREFIEDADLSNAIEDTNVAIYNEFIKPENTEVLKCALGESYEVTLKDLKKLKEVEEDKGTFNAVKGAIDQRQESVRGSVNLHPGYDIFAGIKGSKLSGGQKQRIAIARAVIRQPHILLLDEATSALDENSQKMVQEALDKVMTGRTALIIAHRLTTVEKCNRLAVIADGVVAEEGSYDQLLNKEGGSFNMIAQGLSEEKK